MKLPSTNFLPAAARRPIGNLRDLGTTREWATEIGGIALVAAVLLALYILS